MRFDRPGVELDLGGIGKGYAVDRVVDLLRRRGIASALVNLGGSSVYGLGAPPGTRGLGDRDPGPDRPREDRPHRDAAGPRALRVRRLRALLREGRRHVRARHGPADRPARAGRPERRGPHRPAPPTATPSTTSSSSRDSTGPAPSCERYRSTEALFFLPQPGGSWRLVRVGTLRRILCVEAGRVAAERSTHAPPRDRTALLLALTVVAGLAAVASAAPTLKGRAVWANPRDAGTTEASVVAFVEQLAKAHVNTLIMELKTSGGLFWPSERFAPAVVAEYREFDLPAVLIRECHKRKIAFHVWFFDFAEGGNSYVAQQHPEWLALSPEGKPTTAEVLRGQPYRMAWMCPARRPGYTDQWLIPLIKEFAERYDVDAIHHDYVRYPGRPRPRHLLLLRLLPRGDPEVRLLLLDDPPRPPAARAHGPPAPRGPLGEEPEGPAPELEGLRARDEEPVPARGQLLPGRQPRPRLLLLRVPRAPRGASSRARSSRRCGRCKPRMEFSAAVFKNPVQSGRFIGQDWRRFSPWVQYLMPMDYRSHYAGDFETHLDLLAESIQQQKVWARDFPHFWPGVAAYQLYDEEREPLTRLRGLLRDGGKDVAEMQAAFDKVAPRLKTHAPELHDALARVPEGARGAPEDADREARGVPRRRAGGLLPAGTPHEGARARARPGRRGRRASSRAAGSSSAKLWTAVGEFFGR